MKKLPSMHPAQLVLGVLICQEEIARRKGQTTFAMMSAEAAEWAAQECEVLAEIATDAEYGIDLCHRAADDGVITQDELDAVESVLGEIRTEALEGRVI